MATAEDEALVRLKSLHRDLLDLSQSRLPNIERLQLELESRIDDFRKLLDHPTKNDKSRQALSSDKITIGEDEYQINDFFKQETIQLADLLNLDELEAAKLYAQAVEDAPRLDRPALVAGVILFHERRQYLLECLRVALQIADDTSNDQEDVQSIFHELRGLVLQGHEGARNGPSEYWKKCLEALKRIENWLHQLNERVQSLSMTGQIETDAFAELFQFQLSSLNQQHQGIGAIMYYIVRAGRMSVADFRLLIGQVRTFERYDVDLVHYLPAFYSGVSYLNSHEGQCSAAEGESLNNSIVSIQDNDAWSLRSFQAASTCIWLAEYSCRFGTSSEGSNAIIEGDDPGSKSRQQTFTAALRDGAFQFLLAVNQDVRQNPWVDALRQNLVGLLLRERPVPRTDRFPVDEYFENIFMEQMQSFTEACITNMPDTLRDLKLEEDELRRQMQSRVQLQSDEYEYHLERFLLLVAFAYEGFEEAANSFWSEVDGNMYGFLQWASQRQSTPHVAAFCEMLRALATGENGAGHAHKFLLDDNAASSGRLRRNSPLSWAHIIREIEFYSSAVRDRPTPQQGKPQADQYVEPESAAMLELYLRLLTHLCGQSPEVRLWFLTHQSFHIHEHLFLLCGNTHESRLRACCFKVLASLLRDKSREVGDGIWSALDAWISGISSTSILLRPFSGQNSGASAEQLFFDLISSGFDESIAFVSLLNALVAPFQEESGLDDALPFPESLGAAYRMPGMEPYTDLVLGRVFAAKSTELQDTAHLRLLRCPCLQFISTCLSTFNEELVVYANRSSISVDAAMRTSSLSAYVRMHPFARVMEWLFNESVVAALFNAAQQDIKDVNDASSDSPLITELCLSIQIIDLAMTMQSTYLDIVRPIIKLQSTNRRSIVSNSALASFEDSVLNHLGIVPCLGLYCGSAHQSLVLLSLRLLQKLASSRKLAAPLSTGNGRFLENNRLITALDRNGEVERISRSLINHVQFDESELEQGPLFSGYIIKVELFRFLNGCLATNSDRPNIAHALLGFACQASSLNVSDDSLWAKDSALFHVILNYTLSLPTGNTGNLSSWLVTIKEEALAVILRLLKSPLSASIVLDELRRNDFLVAQWIREPKVTLRTLWDGQNINAVEFYLTSSCTGLTGLLRQRSEIFDYAAMELRFTRQLGLTSLCDRLKSAILGVADLADGQSIQCQTLFELFSFIDADFREGLTLPESKFFDVQDLEMCREEESLSPRYNVGIAEQLLALRFQEMRGKGEMSNLADEQQMHADAANISACLHVNNRKSELSIAHTAAMKSWTQLVIILLDSCEFETRGKESFIVRTLQTILPQLEQSYANDISTAITLAKLGRSLLRNRRLQAMQGTASTSVDAIDECFFQLFRVALAGIQSSETPPDLRETWIHVCHEFIRGLLTEKSFAQQRRVALQNIKARGNGLFEALCDDGYAGDGSSRTSALLLLGAATALSTQEGSKYIVDAFTRINFVQVIVDNMRNISAELQAGANSGQVLAYHSASLSLLLNICQTRYGASQVVNSGLFFAVRTSGLFNADPDLGIELENPAALNNYFGLLLAVVRIVNAAVLSRGPDNDQTIAQARQFLDEYRFTIAAIFKRSAKIGLGGGLVREANQQVLEMLADSLTTLMMSSGFLDNEEERDSKARAPLVFT